MATVSYHDWSNWTTSSNSTMNYSWNWNTSSTTGSSVTYDYVYSYRMRSILVEPPSHWTLDDVLAFVHMVNFETNTGWTITMVFKDGDIIITDPNVERRTMKDFIPLLKSRISLEDKKIINAFFDSHPLDVEAAQ